MRSRARGIGIRARSSRSWRASSALFSSRRVRVRAAVVVATRSSYTAATVSFDDDTALRPLGDGAYEGRIHEYWWTPRGPLGGFVMALVLRGLSLAVDDAERLPRTLTTYFLRPPIAGPVTVRPAVERVGRSLTTTSARLEQDGKLVALALAAFSSAWPGPELSEAPMPEIERSVGRLAASERPERLAAPPFLDLLTLQRRFGEPPFTRADSMETGGWLGLREEREIDGMTVAVLADAWFPAPWPRLRELAPAPTIEMTVLFRAPLPLPDSLLLGRFRTRLVRDGFFEEDGELWSPDGSLVAQSRQLGLLIGAEV
jgi:acyl-CoA thioesterase